MSDAPAYFGGRDGLHAIDSATGEVAWIVSTSAPITSNVFLAGDKVLFGCSDGRLYAVDADEGAVAWSIPTENESWFPLVVSGSAVIFAGSGDSIGAAAISSGDMIWRRRERQALAGAPTIQGGMIWFATVDGVVHGLDALTGKEKWAYPSDPDSASAACAAEPADAGVERNEKDRDSELGDRGLVVGDSPGEKSMTTVGEERAGVAHHGSELEAGLERLREYRRILEEKTRRIDLLLKEAEDDLDFALALPDDLDHLEVSRLLEERGLGEDFSVDSGCPFCGQRRESETSQWNEALMRAETAADSYTRAQRMMHTLLGEAAEKGLFKEAYRLLRAGADLNAANERGLTPLMRAAGWGQLAVLRLLISRGADMNAKSRDGHTALTASASWGHLEVTRCLLNNGADVNSRVADGWTPLMWASSKGHLEVVRLLLQRGADSDLTGRNGHTALSIAYSNAQHRIAEMLEEHGQSQPGRRGPRPENDAHGRRNAARASFDPPDGSDRRGGDLSPEERMVGILLREAAEKGLHEEVRRLLDEGADVESRGENGVTALMCAVARGRVETAKLLLARGAHPHSKDKHGNTALTAAVKLGHSELAKMLAGVSRDDAGRNASMQNALALAKTVGHHEIERMLESGGARWASALSPGRLVGRLRAGLGRLFRRNSAG
jgi:ankyrin repeat protein